VPRSSTLITLSAGLLLSAAVAMEAQAPERLAGVELRGDWKKKDRSSTSAVVEIGQLLLMASDEVPHLLVGRRANAEGTAFDFKERIRLDAHPGGDPTDEEVDLEAIAVAGDLVYAIGSHSATRKTADGRNRTQAENRQRQLDPIDPRPRRNGLFPFRVDTATGTVTPLPRLDVIRPILDSDPILRPFARLPGKENGVDLEGLAFHDGKLYAGFRGPVLRHGLVPVLRFAPAAGGEHDILFVSLGGRGIRDLARVSDGFLVLAGPVGDSDQSHEVFWWNGLDCVAGKDVPPCGLTRVATLPAATGGGRSEGLFVSSETATTYDVLVVHDGAAEGHEAVRYRLQKP
jgi:hypothetical protein